MIATSSVRVVMPIPPRQWFGGFDRRGTLVVVKELEQRFGTTFYQLDTTPFISGDVGKQKEAIDNLRAYRPQLAIAPANYGLLSAVKTDHGRTNVFTDILGIPVIMLWDHGLFAFPSLILSPLPERPEESADGSLHKVSEVIGAPLMHHFPIDGGQVAEMRRIGMMQRGEVEAAPPLVQKAFLDGGLNARADYINDVAFFGNVLLSDQYRLKADTSPAGRCREAVVNSKRANPSTPGWKLLVENIEALDPADRAAARLDYDQSYFWYFANDVVNVHCQTLGRMQALDSLKRKVAFYGAFADPAGVPRLKESEYIDYKGNLHFATELPQAYARTRITVDVTNAAFITNCSPKPLCCFASGGFVLFDHKPEPISYLGNDVEKVMYRSFDELNAKIDYFLVNEREREALADHLKEVIRRKCSFTENVHAPAIRILEERAGSGVWAELKGIASRVFGALPRRNPAPMQVDDDVDQPIGPTRRLAAIGKRPEVAAEWPGAAVLSDSPVQIRTADSAWGYSALFHLPKEVQRRGTPGGLWVEARLRMVNGRAGVGILLDDGAFTEERVISSDDGPCTLFLPLRAAGQRALLIRSAGVPTSTIEVADIALVADARFLPKGAFKRLRPGGL